MKLSRLVYIPIFILAVCYLWVLPGYAQPQGETETYCSTDVPVDLPPFFNTVTSDLIVPIPGVNPNRRVITNAIVKLQIDHIRRRDLLEVSLTSPQNTTVLLFGSGLTGVGGDGENFGSQCLPMPNFILDDSAAQSVTTFSTIDPPAQTFIPQQPLSIFNGEEQGGSWTLTMVNGIDPGVLNCWCLEITSIPPAPIPTLSEWGLISMAGVLGIIGLLAIRRRKVTA